MTDVNLQPIKDAFSVPGPVAILFGPNPNLDQVASSLALYLSLVEAGKEVLIASPAELRAEFTRLVGLDKITQTLSNRNLVVAFKDYSFDQVENISRNVYATGFELVIQPKAGVKAPTPESVEFSFKGANASTIITLGISKLEDLGQIFESERRLFSDSTVIALNRRETINYQAIAITDSAASSYAEIVTEFIEQIGFTIPADAATNLLSGIDQGTNRFQNPVISPTAFLAAGRLLQLGARRMPPRPGDNTPANPFMSFNPMSQNPFTSFTSPKIQPDAAGFTSPMMQTDAGFASPKSQNDVGGPTMPLPFASPKFQTEAGFASPKSQNSSSPSLKPLPPLPNVNSTSQAELPPSKSTPPKDWLEPKIYTGGSKV